MDEYVFLDKSKLPSEKELEENTPLSYKFIGEIRAHIISSEISCNEEWKYYSKKTGWTKKLLVNKRNLFFLTPLTSGSRISFIFGDKAVQEINKSKLPQQIKDEINEAKKYAEGRGLSIIAKSRADLKNILELIDIKIRIK